MSKYRPVEFNAQAIASETLSYRDLRKDFYPERFCNFTAYCLDAPEVLPTGRVSVSAPGRAPAIEYVKREA